MTNLIWLNGDVPEKKMKHVALLAPSLAFSEKCMKKVLVYSKLSL